MTRAVFWRIALAGLALFWLAVAAGLWTALEVPFPCVR